MTRRAIPPVLVALLPWRRPVPLGLHAPVAIGESVPGSTEALPAMDGMVGVRQCDAGNGELEPHIIVQFY